MHAAYITLYTIRQQHTHTHMYARELRRYMYRNNKSTVEMHYAVSRGEMRCRNNATVFLLSVHRIYVVSALLHRATRTFFFSMNKQNEERERIGSTKAFTVVETQCLPRRTQHRIRPEGSFGRIERRKSFVRRNRRTRRVSLVQCSC